MRRIIIILSITISLYGCSASEDIYLEEEIVLHVDTTRQNQLQNQNKWIYEQMDYQYFWTDDIPDSASLNFSKSSTTFFKGLLSPQDRFSWIESNDSYSGESAYHRFGLEYQTYLLNASEKVNRVLFVKKNSIADISGLKRGMWFKSSGDNTKSGDVFSLTPGNIVGNDFIPADTPINLSTATKVGKTSYSVSVDTLYSFEGHKIGYFVYDEFMDGSGNVGNPYRMELRDMFTRFNEKGITDLIIDLRYNHGGHVSICQYLCALTLADKDLETISGYHKFNERLSLEQYKKTGNREEILYFPSKDDLFQKNIGMKRLYVILTENTYSASESLVNTLEPLMEVITIGTNSGGKGVGSWTIKDNKYAYQLQPITFRYYNRNHQTVLDEGITPDIYADEKLAQVMYELGDTRELLLSKALGHILGVFSAANNAEYDPLLLSPIDKREPHRKISGYILEHN